MSNELYINPNLFKRRITKIYQHWKDDNDTLSKCDAIVISIGINEDVMYSKSNSLQSWLFGYELPDMLAIFLANKIYFLASKKKAEFLKQIENTTIPNVPPINILIRDKGDMDKKNFESIITAIKQSNDGKNIGIFAKDKFSGDFIDSWNSMIKTSNFNTSDVSNAFALIMAVKDEIEIGLMQKSSNYTSDIFTKYFRTKVMEIVDQDKKVKHSKLASGIEEALGNTKYITESDSKQVEVCYNPIIQSGANQSLKFSIVSDKNDLQFNVITCCMGVRYKSYCSNIVRTLLVNPSTETEENYNFLCRLEEELLKHLTPGNKLCDVYQSVLKYVETEKPECVEKLTKNFGFGTGIEFRESGLLISPKCVEMVRGHMTFNVTLGLGEKDHALFLGDTVLISLEEGSPATPMTTTNKKFKQVAIIFKDESGEESASQSGDENGEVSDRENNSVIPLGRGLRKTVLESKLRNEGGPTDDKRRNKQEELFLALNAEANKRMTEKKDETSVEKVRKANISYKAASQMPNEPEIRDLKLFVDKKHETVILPIFGLAVPFHISTIKNISQSVEGGFTYLRLNFFHPGASLGKGDSALFPHPEANFVKEITYRSSNSKMSSGDGSAPSTNLNTAFRLIKEVQKKFKTREAELKEMEGIVVQDKLALRQGPNPRLKDLYIRPNLAQKRITGTLEAHANGLRYTSIRGDKVDILYNNIKHAFYQPCDHEMIILLHFHLKHGIILGKKKNQDIQFYTEVGEITTDLGKRQHMHDRDDLQSEQAERELRHKLNTAFKTFCEKVEAQCKQEIEFDTPFRELGFPGVPFRSTVLLQPTSGCLVNLVEWPPFVITLDEIELVHFERVQFHLKNFDVVFVFKDYGRKVVMVNAVPMTMLDPVKEWLNSCDMYYTEGIQSLNWTKIMKTITDDPEGFFANGGWSFLKSDSPSDAENGEEGESDEEEESYEPSQGEEEEEEESSTEADEEDEDYSDDESDGSSTASGGSGSGSEESGKDWDELEAEAAKADRERDMDDYDEDRHPTSNKKSSAFSQGKRKNGPSKSNSASNKKFKR